MSGLHITDRQVRRYMASRKAGNTRAVAAALSGFTEAGGLAITVAGGAFSHRLYHFWLAYSGWQFVKAICGGESLTALAEALQEALWQLGGVPRTHRTDRLSAAYRNLASREDEAARYAE